MTTGQLLEVLQIWQGKLVSIESEVPKPDDPHYVVGATGFMTACYPDALGQVWWDTDEGMSFVVTPTRLKIEAVSER